jgi:hypothetical protein
MDNINYKTLFDCGEFIASEYDGSCKIYLYNGAYFIVLSDNTVIGLAEDLDDPIFKNYGGLSGY